jgi:hypothetical protein
MDRLSERLGALERGIGELKQDQRRTEWQMRWWRRAACLFGVVSLFALALPPGQAAGSTASPSVVRRLRYLEGLLSHFSVSADGREVYLTGANLHLRNGQSTTESANGLGNLIVGYGELGNPNEDLRTGSHNVMIGSANSFSSYGGLVVGRFSSIAAPYASVSGGYHGQVKPGAEFGAISGGADNTVTGIQASISGGLTNLASGRFSSIGGGDNGEASGTSTHISGGSRNKVSGTAAAINGGFWNEAPATCSTVSGGAYNKSTGNYSSVTGGTSNEAQGENSAISGGRENIAQGFIASVSGGRFNWAMAESSTVSGGYQTFSDRSYQWSAGGSVAGHTVTLIDVIRSRTP